MSGARGDPWANTRRAPIPTMTMMIGRSTVLPPPSSQGPASKETHEHSHGRDDAEVDEPEQDRRRHPGQHQPELLPRSPQGSQSSGACRDRPRSTTPRRGGAYPPRPAVRHRTRPPSPRKARPRGSANRRPSARLNRGECSPATGRSPSTRPAGPCRAGKDQSPGPLEDREVDAASVLVPPQMPASKLPVSTSGSPPSAGTTASSAFMYVRAWAAPRLVE